MIDVHCHILPGVDDGAATEEESCMMAALAVESGITDIVATPHCNVPGTPDHYAGSALTDRLNALQALLEREKIPLRLHSGMEVYMTSEVPELLRRKQLMTLAGSRYLLVEFDFDEDPFWAEEMVTALRSEGVVPVVAHPERYYFMQDERRYLLRWIRMGCLLQVNKGSLFGMFGRRASETAHWCLETGCLHCIGSDAHSPYRRTTRLRDIWEYIAEYHSPEAADCLLRDNPGRILRDRTVEPLMAEF